ncbi:Peptidoglycan-binding lysin domain protein [Desulfonatronospira thiodismutans ASO3-1]|uniref:Peptidoglycan-binding lysin domain protein n=1 Tax=Desulfonatronospira thiodismutans ASO3-1 TaxID=555779 RepID=D6STN1_9BACT|nr:MULTISPECIES: LysM peptidoglycan-binding domain-containing protein [Desulfonatronospira]EFI34047.1 Peptidoglycan-binding lysin domain protein [Desulfonatronospira thiodismutans ASO3-1]RQD77020.1 MAG: LysM peptidoglycan-binding domain-containing protein [Desulfonatronospira sp. MSAO_Bac3]
MEKKNWINKLDDLEEDQPKENSNPRRKQFGMGRPPDNLISYIAGGAGIALVIILVVIFARGGDDVSSQELQEISSKLQNLEERMQILEEQAEERQVAFTDIWETSRDLNRRLEDQRENIDDMRQQLAALEEDPPVRPDPEPVQPPEPAERPEPEADEEYVYHEVQAGENLFRISLEYDISVDEIRELNDLGPDDPIQPGQKIRVSQ